MFSGYGGAEFAFKKANINIQVIGYCEIDSAAIKIYENNFGNHIKNYGDVSKMNVMDVPEFDILTAGFPCQPFSVAGKQMGELDPRGTLFFDILRIAKHHKPKYMILENVKGLTTKKFTSTFNKIIQSIEELGYIVNWKVLNSKDYGVPQNRERVWFVCIRNDINNNFKFPDKMELKTFLQDILLSDVDNKYLLTGEILERVKSKMKDKNITKPIMLHNIYGGFKEKEVRIFDTYSPTIRTPAGGGHLPFIMSTLTEAFGRSGSSKEYLKSVLTIKEATNIYRKLTPRECFRLMGFLNDEIILEGLSDTKLYKLAGNGWDINLASKIIKNIFTEEA